MLAWHTFTFFLSHTCTMHLLGILRTQTRYGSCDRKVSRDGVRILYQVPFTGMIHTILV